MKTPLVLLSGLLSDQRVWQHQSFLKFEGFLSVKRYVINTGIGAVGGAVVSHLLKQFPH